MQKPGESSISRIRMPALKETFRSCNRQGPCCVLSLRMDDNRLRKETNMTTLSFKLTALAGALLMNSLLIGAVGFLFALQTHPYLS
jgi:hypothetical protein